MISKERYITKIVLSCLLAIGFFGWIIGGVGFALLMLGTSPFILIFIYEQAENDYNQLVLDMKNAPKINTNEWITWNYTEKVPYPKHVTTAVDIKYRNGEIILKQYMPPRCWIARGKEDDVIAYRKC